MIDINYINSLPELPANPTTGGTYKVSPSNTERTFNPAGNSFVLYILQGSSENATITLSQNAIFGGNSKLFIMGKVKIQGSVTFNEGSRIIMGESGILDSDQEARVIAKQCSFEAPITQVFGNNITAEGIWDIPVAYPQWFTSILPALESYGTSSTPNSNIDWAIYINKAITMKGSGEVFIPKGVYDVASPIHLIPGVQLRGACGVNWDDLGESGKGSTVIRANVAGSYKNPYNDYIVYVNVIKNSEGKWIAENTSMFQAGTLIENISFKAGTWAQPRCIVAACPCHFNNLSFRQFRQCIKYLPIYCDGRRITNCNIGDDFTEKVEDDPAEGEIYQIDLYSNGDGCIIEGTGIGSKQYKGLKVGNSCGTKITGNIINAPVHIRYCKGVVFSCNHMESNGGLCTNNHLEISNSVVTLEGNYFEKMRSTSVIIEDGEYGDTSVVTLIGNQFVYIAGILYSKESLDERIDRIKNTSEYDIQIDSRSVISLIGNFRYAATSNSGVTSAFPFGISISKNVGSAITALDDFNNLSHKLSQECLISGLKIVSQSVSLDDSGDTLSSLLPVNTPQFLIGSMSSSTTYEYKYCIYPDGVKPTTESYKNVSVYRSPTTTKGGNAIMMTVSFAQSGGRGRVKLVRSYTENNSKKSHYVILPICGARYLYDNGLAIAGYKWISE